MRLTCWEINDKPLSPGGFFDVAKLDCFSEGLRFAAVVILAVVFIVLCPNTSFAEPNQTILGEEQKLAVHLALEGEWICNIGSIKVRLQLTDDHKFSLDTKEGNYLVDGTKLTLKSGSSQDVYDFNLEQDQLSLSGGDLNQPLKFTRLPGVGGSKKWLSAFSVKSLQAKCYHILSIVIFVILCRIVLIFFRALIRFIIYSNWGPMRFLCRQHKNRNMTMYSLVINIAKYVVYLLALGFALSELGVNYTAYFASLSVIGLAIGFGSQGLVQDMVTGFFIIFEGQFNVGDMVEIPPHVGIVEELGLRMTRLRNYLGQTVTIPNRNIASVGNFVKGAQQAQIDVAIANKEIAQEAQNLLKQVTNEISCQILVFAIIVPDIFLKMKLESVSFQDRIIILLEKRLSGVAV